LAVLAAPLNALIVRALEKEQMRLTDLRARVGCPAQTTLRGHLNELIEYGIVAKVERREMPYAVSHELSPAGRELLLVADVIDDWLAGAPGAELKLGTDRSKAAIKALARGWSSAILRALAAGPRSLTELDTMIAAVSYPSLERRLSMMRLTGLIEAISSTKGKGTPYTPTDWARRGVAPLTAAGRWERLHLAGDTEPITWIEVEAAFLLALPLIELPKRAAGECVLAVDTKEDERRIAGVHLTVEAGAIVSCDAELGTEPPTFALGSAAVWLDAVIDGKVDGLHRRGDEKLIAQLVGGLHDALFGGR
jgi:DNA-binding HxlR family transcriptional regulator